MANFWRMGNPAASERTEPCTPLQFTADTAAERQLSLEQRVIGWFDQLRGPVLAYLLAMRVRHCEAEEIIQETFMALYAHLENGRDDRNIRGWVFRVAHNIAVNRFKASKYEDHAGPETWRILSETAADSARMPDQVLMEAERSARIQSAIANLSCQQLQCLNLRVEGFRYREIAEILGVTVSTVAELLRRAVSKLSKEAHE